MNKNITELIPQRAPIVMADEFLCIDGDTSRTRFTVREDNIFVDGDIFSECGVIEHMAQSAAARVGYIFSNRGEDVPLGYIGAVNDFVITELPQTGDTIETEITVLQEIFGITLIEARSAIDGREIASCKMKIFSANNEAQS